jgi:RNA polymerase sigma-70 factor (ECF subfamily)
MSDGELVRQSLSGRTQAYEELVRRWAGRVTALCHAKIGRADAAEDLAQETLLRGYRNLAKLAESDKFGSWLCGIAVRACLDWLKAKQRGQIPFSAFSGDRNLASTIPARPENDGIAIDRQEELSQLMSEVERLPDEYREVLMHYYYEDVTYRDLAEMMGVSRATINARLTKARALLRERLSKKVER